MMYYQSQVFENVIDKQKELLPLAASVNGEAVSLADLGRSVIIANCHTNNEKDIGETGKYP
jgi:hypothetical protein